MEKKQKVKIKITKPGLHGKDGPIKVGTTFELSEEPTAWKGRYVVIGEEGEDADAVNNGKKKQA